MKTGKLPARSLELSPRLEPHLLTGAEKLPQHFTWLNSVPNRKIDWGMYGNDIYNDCTIAAEAHAIKLWTGVSDKQPAEIPLSAALQTYSRVTGFNESTGANNVGAYVSDVMADWRANGIDGHKLDAYGRIDHTNLDTVKETIRTLGGVYVGTWLPAAWEHAPKAWRVMPGPAADTHEQHAVYYIGWGKAGFVLVSWGRLYAITYAAHRKYVDEAWGCVSKDWLNKNGVSPEKLDLPGLEARLDEYDGRGSCSA